MKELRCWNCGHDRFHLPQPRDYSKPWYKQNLSDPDIPIVGEYGISYICDWCKQINCVKDIELGKVYIPV